MRDKEIRSTKLAKSLRRRMTDAEIILWSRLRYNPIHKFRRQHPVGPYVADFACVLPRVIIEVDGTTHGTDKEVAHDLHRDSYLKSRGWRVIRFTNQDVYKSLDDLVDAIFGQLPIKSK